MVWYGLWKNQKGKGYKVGKYSDDHKELSIKYFPTRPKAMKYLKTKFMKVMDLDTGKEI